MKDLYNFYSQSPVVINTYNSWESSEATSCVCDYGFTGVSCEIGMSIFI